MNPNIGSKKKTIRVRCKSTHFIFLCVEWLTLGAVFIRPGWSCTQTEKVWARSSRKHQMHKLTSPRSWMPTLGVTICVDEEHGPNPCTACST